MQHELSTSPQPGVRQSRVGRLLAAAIMLSAALVAGPAAARADAPDSAPVVVELFTSRACAACPPADAHLARSLVGRKDVIALSYHVDYLNHLGWRDPLSRPAFSARQRAYARALGQPRLYAPQIVIDGRVHLIGSEAAAVDAMIAVSKRPRTQTQKGPVLGLRRSGSTGFLLSISGANPSGTALDVLIVPFDSRRETVVAGGPNQGRKIINAHVAHDVATLGRWHGGARRLLVPQGRLTGDGGAVVLLQEADHGPIRAAKILRFYTPPSPPS